jgi:hypothetical protein
MAQTQTVMWAAALSGNQRMLRALGVLLGGAVAARGVSGGSRNVSTRPATDRAWRGPTEGITVPWGCDGRSFSGSAEQLADARDDLVAVQLDVGHELFVCQAWHAVLEVEPGGAKGAEVRGDLVCDGFG